MLQMLQIFMSCYGFFVFFLVTLISGLFLLVGLLIDKCFFETKISYWTLGAKLFIKLFGVRHCVVLEHPLIPKGFILANHRCFFDFAWDPVISNSSGVARLEATLITTFLGIVGYLENRMIIFKRGKTNSHQLFSQLLKTMTESPRRIMFYPEGTRCNYLTLADAAELKTYLRYGLLKRIYEHQKFPVQLTISSNKEQVFNEKTFHSQYGVTVKSAISEAIHPKDFTSFDDFIQKIADTWIECYRLTHSS